MAATVEGAFVILDRASGPMERMQRQAKKTDLAVKGLGERLDKIGGHQQLQRLERTERALKDVDRAGGHTNTTIDRTSRTMDRASRSSQTFTDRLIRTGAALMSIGKIAMAGKLLLMASAIGVAVQAVTTLTAGAIALIPQLVDLGGAAGALPAVFAGVGLAVGTVKLAFGGLGKAMGGNKAALKALTPEARQFLDTLKGYQPVVKDLRRSAQQGLFPGLDESLQNLRRGVPMANRLLGRAGHATGRAAAQASARLTDPARLRDIERVGNQGVRVISRMGVGATNLALAFTDLVVAAVPFTDWLTITLLHFTRFIEAEAHAGRESGRMTRFFDRSRRALEQTASIGVHLWHVLRDVGHASRTLGTDLWDSIEGTTARWEKWTASLEGQNQLARWFIQARAPVHEMAGLIGDLGKAIFGFNTGGLTETIRHLRDGVPALTRFLESMASAGPSLADLIRGALELGANLSGALGPVQLLLRSLTRVLDILNQLIDRTPMFGHVLAAAITLAGIFKLRGALMGLASTWGIVGRSAAAAGAAQAGAAGTRAGGGMVGVLGRAAGGRAGSLGGAMGLGGTLAAERALMRQSGINPNAAGALRGQAGTLAGAGALAAKTAGASVLRMMGPLALFGGGLGALQGTGGRGGAGLMRNVLSGASFGLLPSTAALSAGQSSADERSLQRVLGGMRPAGVAGTQQQLGRLGRMRQMAVRERSGEQQRTLTDAIDAEITARREMLPLLRQERAARSRDRGAAAGEQIGRAFRTDLRHGRATDAFANLRHNILGPGGVAGRNFPGARAVAQQSLQMAREAARGNPKLQKEYDRLARGVADRFDRMGRHVTVVNSRILSSSARDWARIREGISQPAEQARQRASSALSAIQRAAIGALRDMGYSQKDAASIVRGARANASALPRNPAGDRAALQGFVGGANKPAQGSPLSPLAVPGGLGPGGDGIGDGRGSRRALTGSPSLMGAKVGLMPYATDAAGYGLHVSSGLRPGAITSSGNVSYHSSGDAIDLAGSAGDMLRFFRHARSSYGAQLEELIHTPGGVGIKNGRPFTYTGQVAADHFDHVHLADKQNAGALTGAGVGGGGVGGATGFGLPALTINAPTSGVGGASGALADTAMAAMAKGLESKINDQLGATGLGLPGGAGGGGGGSFASMVAAVGLPPIFNAIIRAESGGNPHARNASGASGLLQIMMPLHQALVARFGGNVFDPMTNLRVGKYLYDQSGLSPWTPSRGVWGKAMGDGIGWGGVFAGGGAMRVRRPTLFMAGDRGEETVRVQRSTQRPGVHVGRGVTIRHITIHNHRAGDIEEQIRDEVDRAFASLGDELDGTGIESEEALL